MKFGANEHEKNTETSTFVEIYSCICIDKYSEYLSVQIIEDVVLGIMCIMEVPMKLLGNLY